MSTQVIVLKRPRLKFFAIPRALPALLRSFRAGRPGLSTRESDVRSSPAATRSPFVVDATRFPELVIDDSGAHRCSGCQLCDRLCPSRCLQIKVEAEGTPLRAVEFEVTRARCIGCGACVDVCPENAIEMSTGAEVETWIDIDPIPSLRPSAAKS